MSLTKTATRYNISTVSRESLESFVFTVQQVQSDYEGTHEQAVQFLELVDSVLAHMVIRESMSQGRLQMLSSTMSKDHEDIDLQHACISHCKKIIAGLSTFPKPRLEKNFLNAPKSPPSVQDIVILQQQNLLLQEKVVVLESQEKANMAALLDAQHAIANAEEKLQKCGNDESFQLSLSKAHKEIKDLQDLIYAERVSFELKIRECSMMGSHSPEVVILLADMEKRYGAWKKMSTQTCQQASSMLYDVLSLVLPGKYPNNVAQSGIPSEALASSLNGLPTDVQGSTVFAVEATPAETLSITGDTPSYDQLFNAMVTSMLEKPKEIAMIDWDKTNSEELLLYSFSLPGSLFASKLNTSMPGADVIIGCNTFYKCGFRIMLNFDCNAAYTGVLMVSWDINGRIMNFVKPAPSSSPDTIRLASANPHIFVDISKESTAVLEIPFSSVYDLFAFARNPMTLPEGYLGNVMIHVISPLSPPNSAAAAKIPIRVMASVFDAQLEIPCPLQSPNIIHVAGPKEGMQPGALRYGNEAQSPVTPQLLREDDQGIRLAGVYENKSPSILRGEESILKSLQHPCIIDQRTWSASESIKILASYAVHPCSSGKQAGAEIFMSRLAYTAQCFTHWSGDLDFHFTFAANGSHHGQILFAYQPTARLPMSAELTPDQWKLQETHSVIFDLSLGHEVTVRVPYLNNTPYSITTTGLAMSRSTPGVHGTGVLHVCAHTPLVSTFPDNQDVMITTSLSAGENFTFLGRRQVKDVTKEINIAQNSQMLCIPRIPPHNVPPMHFSFADLSRNPGLYYYTKRDDKVSVMQLPVAPSLYQGSTESAIAWISRSHAFWSGDLIFDFIFTTGMATNISIWHDPCVEPVGYVPYFTRTTTYGGMPVTRVLNTGVNPAISYTVPFLSKYRKLMTRGSVHRHMREETMGMLYVNVSPPTPFEVTVLISAGANFQWHEYCAPLPLVLQKKILNTGGADNDEPGKLVAKAQSIFTAIETATFISVSDDERVEHNNIDNNKNPLPEKVRLGSTESLIFLRSVEKSLGVLQDSILPWLLVACGDTDDFLNMEHFKAFVNEQISILIRVLKEGRLPSSEGNMLLDALGYLRWCELALSDDSILGTSVSHNLTLSIPYLLHAAGQSSCAPTLKLSVYKGVDDFMRNRRNFAQSPRKVNAEMAWQLGTAKKRIFSTLHDADYRPRTDDEWGYFAYLLERVNLDIQGNCVFPDDTNLLLYEKDVGTRDRFRNVFHIMLSTAIESLDLQQVRKNILEKFPAMSEDVLERLAKGGPTPDLILQIGNVTEKHFLDFVVFWKLSILTSSLVRDKFHTRMLSLVASEAGGLRDIHEVIGAFRYDEANHVLIAPRVSPTLCAESGTYNDHRYGARLSARSRIVCRNKAQSPGFEEALLLRQSNTKCDITTGLAYCRDVDTYNSVLFVDDSHFVATSHFLGQIYDKPSFLIVKGKKYNLLVEESSCKKLANRDLSIVPCTAIPGVFSCMGLLPSYTDKEFAHIDFHLQGQSHEDGVTTTTTFASDLVRLCSGDDKYRMPDATDKELMRSVAYSCVSQGGDCGSVILGHSTDPHHSSIIGIHVAGSVDGTVGFGDLIFLEDFFFDFDPPAFNTHQERYDSIFSKQWSFSHYDQLDVSIVAQAPLFYKNDLEELAKKRQWPLPSYKVLKQGPDHAPTFSAVVTVNDVKYTSGSGSRTAKAAEQEAAHIALVRLKEVVVAPPAESSSVLSTPVFYKNELQEKAQKAGWDPPLYANVKRGPDHLPEFFSTVSVNGTKFSSSDAYPNAKAAEQDAARNALIFFNRKDTKQKEHVAQSFRSPEREGLSKQILCYEFPFSEAPNEHINALEFVMICARQFIKHSSYVGCLISKGKDRTLILRNTDAYLQATLDRGGYIINIEDTSLQWWDLNTWEGIPLSYQAHLGSIVFIKEDHYIVEEASILPLFDPPDPPLILNNRGVPSVICWEWNQYMFLLSISHLMSWVMSENMAILTAIREAHCHSKRVLLKVGNDIHTIRVLPFDSVEKIELAEPP